jgi:hypothetical protein
MCTPGTFSSWSDPNHLAQAEVGAECQLADAIAVGVGVV